MDDASDEGTSRRKRALDRFYGGLEQAKDGARRVGWESSAAHAMRLAAVAEGLGPLAEVRTLLDVGCGEAALLPVLRARGFAGRYRGEDLREAPLSRVSGLREGDEVVVMDSFGGRAGRFDAVVCSGALNTDSGRPHAEEVEAAIVAMWLRTERVLVFDLAIADRHAPGVGLAASEILRVLTLARRIAPVVSLREDVIPGEALFTLERSRALAFQRRGLSDVVVAENLLLAGEAMACLEVLGAGQGGRAALIEGQARAAVGDLEAALACLEQAARDAELRVQSELAQASVLWRLGRRDACERLLERLAEEDDEARAHLAELYRGRRDLARARAVAGRIVDPWMAREVLTRLEVSR
jgi:hypothetical protein